VMADGERYTRMMFAAKHELPVSMYPAEQTQILAQALNIARQNQHITSHYRLKRIIKQELRKNLRRSDYGFITWQIILWWILPKLIDWFIAWWFRDKERAKSQ